MKNRLNACLIALGVRFEESRFRQAVDNWQDAHPEATAALDQILHTAMRVLCVLLCAVMVIFAIVLVMNVREGTPVRPVDISFILASLAGLAMGIHALRNW